MQHLLNDVRSPLERNNWYGALGIALALPDICAKLEDQGGTVRKRYCRWFDANVGDRHMHLLSDQTSVQMKGAEAYLLRCAYLHGGQVDIEPDEIGARTYHRFRFICVSPELGPIPRQTLNDELFVSVDEFSIDMCLMVEEWMGRVQMDQEIQQRIAAMPMVFEPRPGVVDHGRWDVGLARKWHPQSLQRNRGE